MMKSVWNNDLAMLVCLIPSKRNRGASNINSTQKLLNKIILKRHSKRFNAEHALNFLYLLTREPDIVSAIAHAQRFERGRIWEHKLGIQFVLQCGTHFELYARHVKIYSGYNV